MQVYDSPYKTCRDCAMDVWHKEGVHAFYRSFFTQLTMNIPFQSIHFMMYEACQDVLNKDREYHPLTHCASGAVAGAVAAGATTPLDVCKTLLNTQERLRVCEVDHGRIEGLTQALRTVHSCCGLKGFFRGLTARVVYQMPSTSISWSIYEFFKYYILYGSGKSKAESDGYMNIVQAQRMTVAHDEVGLGSSSGEDINPSSTTLVVPSIVRIKNKSDHRVSTTPFGS